MCINSILFKMDDIKRQLTLGLVLCIFVLINVPATNGYALKDAGHGLNGCYHNGTWYAEESIVPTMEPCLICKCLSRTLICALKICPEQPIPPPRGCVLVHRNGACCPHLSCTKFHLPSFHSDDRRLVMLAEADRHNNRFQDEEDEAEFDYDNDADKMVVNGHNHLRRSEDDEIENEVCIRNGTIYQSGSAMSSSTLCSYCYCIGGKEKCVKPKCMLSSPKCKPIYADSTCCPIKYDCSEDEGKLKNHTLTINHITKKVNKHYLRNSLRGSRSNGCLIRGYFYPEGHKLPVDPEKPCDICFCIRGGTKCTPKQCAPPIRSCTPRVPRGQCCAASYDCKQISKASPRGINQNDDTDSFDFFSLLFGPEEPENVTDLPVYSTTTESAVETGSSTTERSFFDFIRAGLKLIDSNDETIGNVLEPGNQSISVVKFIEPVTGTAELPTESTTIAAIPTAIPTPEIPPIMSLHKASNASETSKSPLIKHRDSEIINIIPTSTIPFIEKTKNTSIRPNVIERIVATTEVSTTTTATTPSTTTTTPRSTTKSTTVKTSPATTSTRRTTTTTPATTKAAPVNSTSSAPISTTTPATVSTTRKPATQKPTQSAVLRTQKPTSMANRKTAVKSNATEPSTSTTTTTTTTQRPTTVKLISPSKASIIDQLSKISHIVENKDIFSHNVSQIKSNSEVTMKRPNDKFAKVEVTIPTTAKPTTRTTVRTTTAAIRKQTVTVPSRNQTSSTTEKKMMPNTTAKPIITSTAQSISSTTSRPNISTTSKPIVPSTTAGSAIKTKSTSGTATTIKPSAVPVMDATTSTTEMPAEHRTESSELEEETKPAAATVLNATQPATTENILSAFFSELSNILDGKKNSTFLDQKLKKNSTKYVINSTIPPLTPKPSANANVPNKISTNPSILEADYNFDYNDPTLPPSLPNLKIIPFLPADAVNTNSNPSRNKVKYDYYKPPNPTPSYPSITEKYDSPHFVVGAADLEQYKERYNMNPTSYPNENVYGIASKNANSKIDYDIYEATENYNILNPTVHPSAEADANNNIRYNTKFIRDKYDTEYDDYESPELKYIAHDKMDTIPKVIIDSKYHKNNNNYNIDLDKSYLTAYDKFGNNYPDKNVYYNVYPDKYENTAYNTDSPLYNFDDSNMSGFSPPTKTEGGFLPKQPIKEEYFYDKFHTTSFGIDLTTEAPVKLNATHGAIFKNKNVATQNPFKDVIRTEPAPDLHSLIEDKEKLLITRLNSQNYSSIILTNDTENNDFEKDIISITTDINYNDGVSESYAQIANNRTDSKPSENKSVVTDDKINSVASNKTNFAPAAAIAVRTNATDIDADEDMYPTSTGSSELGSTAAESPDMFSFENVFNYLFRDENPVDDNKIFEPTMVSPDMTIPPFKSIPLSMPALTSFTSVAAVENATEPGAVSSTASPTKKAVTKTTTSSTTTTRRTTTTPVTTTTRTTTTRKPTETTTKSTTSVKTTTMKVPEKPTSSEKTTTYTPSLSDLPFLNPAFHLKTNPEKITEKIETISFNPIRSDLNFLLPELKNDIDRFSGNHLNRDAESYQILPDDSSISNTESYVVNPVDIDKLKQHHSEGTAEIFTKPTNINKDTVGILKLAGCNIYGRMYRVGRIISELSGPCLECKCTEVGVHCTPLNC